MQSLLGSSCCYKPLEGPYNLLLLLLRLALILSFLKPAPCWHPAGQTYHPLLLLLLCLAVA